VTGMMTGMTCSLVCNSVVLHQMMRVQDMNCLGAFIVTLAYIFSSATETRGKATKRRTV